MKGSVLLVVQFFRFLGLFCLFPLPVAISDEFAVSVALLDEAFECTTFLALLSVKSFTDGCGFLAGSARLDFPVLFSNVERCAS